MRVRVGHGEGIVVSGVVRVIWAAHIICVVVSADRSSIVSCHVADGDMALGSHVNKGEGEGSMPTHLDVVHHPRKPFIADVASTHRSRSVRAWCRCGSSVVVSCPMSPGRSSFVCCLVFIVWMFVAWLPRRRQQRGSWVSEEGMGGRAHLSWHCGVVVVSSGWLLWVTVAMWRCRWAMWWMVVNKEEVDVC
jgi:hypothetical protein